MKRIGLVALWFVILIGCSRQPVKPAAPAATAYGAAIAEASGGKQIAPAGTLLDQPVVVQVNDAQGNGVTGAYVEVHAPSGVMLDPAAGLTDSSGQFTTESYAGRHGRPVPVDRDHARQGRQELRAQARGNCARLPAGARPANQPAILFALPRSRVHSGARLQHGQPHHQAARVHRRRDAEQDQRCRPDGHHQPWRRGAEQVRRDAALRLHAFQDRYPGPAFLYSRRR